MKNYVLSLLFLVSYTHNACAQSAPAAAAAGKPAQAQQAQIKFPNYDPNYDPDYDSGLEDLEGPEVGKIRAQYQFAAKQSPEVDLLMQAPELLGKSFTALFNHMRSELITLRAQNKVSKKMLFLMATEQQQQGKMLEELLALLKKQVSVQSPTKYIPIQVQPRAVAAAPQNPMADPAKDASK